MTRPALTPGEGGGKPAKPQSEAAPDFPWLVPQPQPEPESEVKPVTPLVNIVSSNPPPPPQPLKPDRPASRPPATTRPQPILVPPELLDINQDAVGSREQHIAALYDGQPVGIYPAIIEQATPRMASELESTPLTPGQARHVDHLLSVEPDTLAREVLIKMKRDGIPSEAHASDFMAPFAEWSWDDLSDARAWALLATIAQSDWDEQLAHADSEFAETVAQDQANDWIEGLVIINAKTGDILLDRTGVVRADGSQYVGLQDTEAEALQGLELIFVHNHPNGTDASDEDLISAFEAGAELLIVITRNGHEYVYIRGRDRMVKVRDGKASYEVGLATLDEALYLLAESQAQARRDAINRPELIFLQNPFPASAVPAGMTVEQAAQVFQADMYDLPPHASENSIQFRAEAWKDQWESNPEDWPDFDDLKRLSPFIKMVAEEWHHPESGMSVDAFAALIFASLHLESRYRRNNPSANYIWNQLGVLHDKAGDYAQRLLGWDSSLGPANVRPTVADEILGTPEKKAFIPLRDNHTIGFFDEGRLDALEDQWKGFAWHDHWGRQKFLKNDENAIAILAANFHRGFERLYQQRENSQLSRYQDDWRPTAFNMLAWTNQGIAESYTLKTDLGEKAERARMHSSRGVAFVSAIIANRSFGLSIDSDDIVMFNDDDLGAYVRILR